MSQALILGSLLSAVMAALLTALLFWLGFRLIFARKLERAILEVQDEFERRVHAGVVSAGQELMPELRTQVRKGFSDALKGTEAAEMVESYASVVNLGTDLIANRIGQIFGVKPTRSR